MKHLDEIRLWWQPFNSAFIHMFYKKQKQFMMITILPVHMMLSPYIDYMVCIIFHNNLFLTLSRHVICKGLIQFMCPTLVQTFKYLVQYPSNMHYFLGANLYRCNLPRSRLNNKSLEDKGLCRLSEIILSK